MNRNRVGIISLILVVVLVSVGVVSAQVAPPLHPPHPDGTPSADTTPMPTPDGTFLPPPDGQPPRRAAYPVPYYAATAVPTVTVYPAQVLILRHIEQSIGTALGLTQAQVNSYRLSETFEQLIAAYGQNVSMVEVQVAADLKAWVMDGLADGSMSQARGTLILNNLDEIVQRAMLGWFNVDGTTVTGLLDGLS